LDVNQETNKGQPKPVLNQEGFQHLLAAAYLLQAHLDRQPSIRPVHRQEASHASSSSADKIVQKRPPTVMIQDRRLQVGQPAAILDHEEATEALIRLGWHQLDTVPRGKNALLRRPTLWKTAETLAIAIVFSVMMGLSISRLWTVPSRTSLVSRKLDEPNERARPTEKVIPSSQAVVGGYAGQSSGVGEADIVAEDIVTRVIRHQERLVNLPRKPGVRLVFGTGAAADTVVQYGSDVKMWLRTPERAALNRLEH
jgi:hypothetical protein